jgi:hypothetical protein
MSCPGTADAVARNSCDACVYLSCMSIAHRCHAACYPISCEPMLLNVLWLCPEVHAQMVARNWRRNQAIDANADQPAATVAATRTTGGGP